MNDQIKLQQGLDQVERLAQGGRWQRFLNSPLRYTKGMWWKEVQYPRLKLGKEAEANTFFGASMKVILPAGMDLFLLGAKGHDSEVRLARWLINTLQSGDIFLDVGAHFGYYSLLASRLVGETGRVVAFEAAPKTFTLLEKNVKPYFNILALPKAVSDKVASIEIYEFPVLYSEYNTLDTKPFEGMEWFKENLPEPTTVPAISLDFYCQQAQVHPTVIKIDVEGAEGSVLKGLQHRLSFSSPQFVMEFSQKNFKEHREALIWLAQFQYTPFLIQKDGTLAPLHSVEAYFSSNTLESDNFVLRKV